MTAAKKRKQDFDGIPNTTELSSARSKMPSRKRVRFSEVDIPTQEQFQDTGVSAQRCAVDAFIVAFAAQARAALERGISIVKSLAVKTSKFKNVSAKRKSTLRTECSQYVQILGKGENVRPINATEYRRRIESSVTDWRNVIVICTSREARDLLRDVNLRVPVLVLSEFNNSLEPRALLSKQRYEDTLRFCKHAGSTPNIDIQDISCKQPTHSVGLDTALKRMNAPGGMPINFLDIRPLRHHVVPWELEGIVDYGILNEATEYGGVGEDIEPSSSDLSNRDSFALWGKQGAWSFTHIEENGTYTGILCEDGDKLWFSWTLNDDEIRRWAEVRQQGERYDPEQAGFPIPLHAGDLLFQPPATVHAPLSLINVVMHGFLVWSSRTMVTTARAALLDLQYPQITNEAPRKELKSKLQHLVQASEARLPPYAWGAEEDHAELAALVGVSVHHVCSSDQLSVLTFMQLILAELESPDV
jgi:hypothetical protein